MDRQEEIDYKMLFEGVPGLFLVLSPNLTILAVSDAYANTMLTGREAIVGKYLFDVFPDNPEDKDTAVACTSASIEYVLQYKIAHAMPIQRHDVRNAVGVLEEKYWSPIHKPILNKDNEVKYIIQKNEDVTEFVKLKLKKRPLSDDKASGILSEGLYTIEAELILRSQELEKLNEQLLKKIAERTIESKNLAKDILDYKVALDAADIVAITDQKGIIQYANDNFCKISKYTKEELIGQNHRIINSGYHSKTFFKNLWQTIGNGAIWKGEIKNKAKDGAVYWVDTTIVPFLNERGKPYKYLAIRSDITDRKQGLEELKKSEEQYRDIFSNALVAIFTIDIHTDKITDVNDKGIELFGYESKEDFLANFTTQSHYVNTKERKRNWVILEEKGELNHIQQLIKRDGSFFWASIFSKLNHTKTMAHNIILDVTSQIAFQDELETKVAERTLELTESLAREKELNEMKSNFLGIASHEFRTPLGTILSSTSLLKKYIENNDLILIEKHIDRISSSVNHLSTILNDLLTLEKLRKGFIDFEMDEFSLPNFIADTISEVEVLAKMNNQRILYKHIGEPNVKQSVKILKNILLNLLSNASKYSEYGKEIQIKSEVSDSAILIRVQDYGIGIPFKDQQKIFTEFYRASNAKSIQGTGLGLVIVKNYVALLEGTIRFTSELNKGTVFTVTLPRYLLEAS